MPMDVLFERARKGITPVVAIILLLMMTVAAAGAAFTWFSQMQEELQTQASNELRTRTSVKDLRCDSGADYINISIKNDGSTQIELGRVDVFVRDSTGHLNATVTNLDWSSSGCDGAACEFGQPGGFDTAKVNIASADSGATALYAGAFYDVEVDFTDAGYSVQAGGCLAADG